VKIEEEQEEEDNDDGTIIDDDDDDDHGGDDDAADDDHGVLMMVDVCTDGVVMMVIGKDDYDKTCWQQHFGKENFCRPFPEMVVSVLMVPVLLLMSWWSLNGVSVVVGVLVALWAVCSSVLTVFGDVLGLAHVFVVFLWCFGGVLW
jgi:hypothetical protein